MNTLRKYKSEITTGFIFFCFCVCLLLLTDKKHVKEVDEEVPIPEHLMSLATSIQASCPEVRIAVDPATHQGIFVYLEGQSIPNSKYFSIPLHKFGGLETAAFRQRRKSRTASIEMWAVCVYNRGMKLTIQVKLLPTVEQATHLLDTVRAMNEAATFAAAIGFAHKVYGQVSIHRLCYRTLRDRFGLGAQHAVRAISKAVDAFSRDRTICPVFRADGAVPLDDRLYRLIGLRLASINTVAGRVKLPFVVGDYFSSMLTSKMGQADLVHRDSQFFLYITVEFQEGPPVDVQDWLGVDLGIVNLAADSEGETFSGEAVRRNRRRRATARKQHQRKGSKSAKRKLKRMSGRQSRYQRWVNHNISKRLVDKAKAQSKGIVLEDLKHIRSRVEDTVGRKFRRTFGNWSFAHLAQCIAYKARLVGVPVVFVSPKNTSRTCSRCGHCAKANRKSQAEFRCLHCGYSQNADLNAALNLQCLGHLVTCPQKQQEARLPLTAS